jgi:hypothetical protein
LLDIDPEYAFELALEYSWPLMNDIDRFEDSKRKVYVAANRLKTGIDFFADASLSSDRPTDYTSFDPDDIRAGMGVELDLPINRFRERNQYRSTIISFEAALRRLSLALTISEIRFVLDCEISSSLSRIIRSKNLPFSWLMSVSQVLT